MTAIDIEKLNQLVSRTDISGNDKVKWLSEFIEGRELQQQERSYSEEEVLDILLLSYSSISDKSLAGADLRKWFEQFKKK